MSSEKALSVVVRFDKLPETIEKAEISHKYLSNEIGNFEFFCLAEEYLYRVETPTYLSKLGV